jgi:hypothetical protein
MHDQRLYLQVPASESTQALTLARPALFRPSIRAWHWSSVTGDVAAHFAT